MNKFLLDFAKGEASLHDNVVSNEELIYTPEEIKNLPIGTSVFFGL